MKICIVAAGLATRLQPLTNYIPKFLINIGKQTGLVEMVRYWKGYSSDFTIIIHPKYEELVRAYFKMYFGNENINLTIKTIESALGTAHTIDTSIGADFDGANVLFTWCDVIPGGALDIAAIPSALTSTNPTVFTIDNQKNRYKFVHNTLVKVDDATGDVFGMYVVPGYKQFTSEYVEGEDFADVLARRGNLNKYEVDSIIDFGDKEKLFDVLKSTDEGREFNSIEISDKLVHKRPLNDQGKGLIAKEIAWYRELHNKRINIDVPTVYPSLDNTELIMERVDGVSIYKLFSDVQDEDQAQILNSIFFNLDKLHTSAAHHVGTDQVFADVKKEAYDKLIARYEEIEDVINAFGKNITVVNGVTINNDPRDIIEDLFIELSHHYKNVTTYSIIHGDLQMSNSMVNPNHFGVKFIDPRGYFGNTQIYGLPDYDLAKVLYSLSGYDLFNYSTSFHIKNITETEIEFDIPTPTLHDGAKAVAEAHFTRVHYLWLAVIWIGLAQYIKNNPIKSVAAHYHGLSLATQFLKDE